MTQDHKTLWRMLSLCRRYQSKGELLFITEFIKPLKPYVLQDDQRQDMAYIVDVGQSDLMFTAHTDTVHRMEAPMNQTVMYANGMFRKDDKMPLGADDAAGVWLMLSMIEAQVPGRYVFFRGEEVGGIGSSYMADHCENLWHGYKACISFDRRGTKSIITSQGGEECCGEAFAKSLASILNMEHAPDPTGVFTDSASFIRKIPNCTNVSVGYYNEHSPQETLDFRYLRRLRSALVLADWSQLDHSPWEPKPKPKRTTLDFWWDRSPEPLETFEDDKRLNIQVELYEMLEQYSFVAQYIDGCHSVDDIHVMMDKVLEL